MRVFPSRLRGRLVLIALLAVAPAVGVLALTQSRGRQRAADQTVAGNLRLVKLAASRQAGVFDAARRLLLTLAEFPGLRAADPGACQALLPNILRAHPTFFNVTVTDAHGTSICSAVPVGTGAPGETRGRVWFERALAQRTTVLGDYQLSATTGRPAIVIAHPLLDPAGRVERIINATIGVDLLISVVPRAELPAGATLTLVDRTQTILARFPDGERWIGQKNPDKGPLLRLMAGATEDTTETVGVDGVRRLYVTVPVRAAIETGLYLGMGVDHAAAFREADLIFLGYLQVLAVLLFGAVGAAMVAGHLFVLNPMKALKTVTAQLAAGDLSARTQLASGLAGVGELEEAVNTMASALDSREQERDLVVDELRASENRYRLLFTKNPHAMWVYDVETLGFLEVNDAAILRYGYSRSEFLGMRITDIRPEEDVRRLTAALEKRREPYHHSTGWRHRLKGGDLIDVEISSHTLTFRERAAALATAHDVTDRTRAQAALLERIASTALTADIGIAMNRSAELATCLHSCAEALAAHMDLARVRIWTIDQTGQTLEMQAGAGPAPARADEWRRLPVADTGIGRIAARRLPHAPTDAAADPDIDDRDWMREQGLTTFLGCPMIVDSRLVGVAAAYSRAPLSEVLRTAVISACELVALGIARHQAEAGRRHSEERVRLIAETVTQVFWIADVGNQAITYVSPAFERIWGRTCDSLYRNPESFLDSLHADDRDNMLRTLRVQQGGRTFDHEYRIVRPDGQIRWIHDRGFPVPSASGVVQYVGVAEDVTERHHADAHMRLLASAVESTSEMVSVTDLNDQFTFVNRAFLRTYGYDRDEVIGKTPALLRPPQAALAGVDAIYAETLGDGWKGELENRRKDGTEFSISLNTSAIRDDRGQIVGLVGVARDISTRLSLEKQLRQSQKMEAVGQLAGGIAHDFNNLLTAILGFAGFLAESMPASDARRADVEEIRQAGLRAADLTRQLLAFSRKQILAVRVLHVGDVVGELTPMLRRLLGGSIELATTIADRGLVKADPGQLHQVIVNLAVNAHAAMPGGGRLTIETTDILVDAAFADRHPSMSIGPHVKLTVTDTGHGMDASTQAHIFEPFFTTKPQGEGTGLGLSTVYGIVKQSGGSVWVDSQVARGTTFSIFLPRTTELAASEPAPAVKLAAKGGAETILVIEDEEQVREYVYQVLSRRGYSVHAFGDPVCAVEYAALHPNAIDLVLSDVVLPNMSGKATVAQVLESQGESKVLFMSGYADAAIVQQGILDPGVEFLPKPFSADDLSRRVRGLLDMV